MTLEKNVQSKRTVTILTTKAHGFLAIEIYGNPDIINQRMDKIDKILDTIKFSENKHNYSKDTAKAITPEEEKEAIENLKMLTQTYDSGE